MKECLCEKRLNITQGALDSLLCLDFYNRVDQENEGGYH